MSTNPLQQNHYAISAILVDVIAVTDEDKQAVMSIIDGSVLHYPELHQMRLHWVLPADTTNDAIDGARATLRRAAEATHAACPRTRLFEVREITT